MTDPTPGDWPAPADEPVVVLLDASTDVERDVLTRWVEAHRPPGADVELMDLPDPTGRHGPAPWQLQARASAEQRDPWLAPLRVVWLPEERDGQRTVWMRDVVRNLGDPRHPHARDQRRIVQRQPDRCRVVAGEPARLSTLRQRWSDLQGEETDVAGYVQFLVRTAIITLERAESRLVGAQYKVPRLVREELAATPRFRAGLAALARELERDESEVVKEAESYLEEMVTGWSRLLVDLGVRLGRYNFKRSYEPNLDLDPDQVQRLCDLAEHHPLVFLPSHKSNLDTLVMNVALHDSGLPRAHVFGGINMAFWPIGPIFRHSGTAYIRRSTEGNRVYKYTLREYMGYLLEKRFSLQFFMEGGRSRTGKLLPPKLGLLAYVAEAFRQGRSDDVVLVPVSIAYDQLQETSDFAREAKGAGKKAESVAWLAKAFREQRGRYGRIYVRFGEPISLRETLPEEDDTEAQRLALQKVALEVSRRISEVTPITATSLVTLALLGAQSRALTLEQVRATVHDPYVYAVRRGLPLARDLDLDTDEGVLRALVELERHDVVSRFDAGRDPVFAIGTGQHLAAAFYRNSVIHFFLHGALAQVGLSRVVRCQPQDVVGMFWDTVLAGRDLLKFEFFFEPREEFKEAVVAELAYQDPGWEKRLVAGPSGVRELLETFQPLTAHTALRSFLEAYGVVAAALLHQDRDDFDERAFLLSCLALGRQYQLQQRIHSPESLSRPLFSTALELAASRGLTDPRADDDARRRFVDEIWEINRDIDVIELLVTSRVMSLISAPE